MRLKRPAQPLVFRLAGATPLCAAAADLYQCFPGIESALCLYGGGYYLRVGASLGQRPGVRRVMAAHGQFLGASPVLYAYWEEHGRCLSANAVEELGRALRGK